MAWEHLQAAETLCQKLGLACWAVRLLSLRGLVLLALGQSQAALAATGEAMARLKPGVEQAYLIPFRHSQALSALGKTQEAHGALEQAYYMLSETLSGLSPQEKKMSWERVPEHRALLAAWQATRPPRTVIRLPRAGVPSGRPLRDDEWVDVHWAVTEPEDDEISNKVARRRRRLLRLLNEAKEQGAAPTVDDLAMALSVSQSTIKRDLAILRQSGHSADTRGSRTSG
jgi:DNA-binding transcriptional ArsR family regulator